MLVEYYTQLFGLLIKFSPFGFFQLLVNICKVNRDYPIRFTLIFAGCFTASTQRFLRNAVPAHAENQKCGHCWPQESCLRLFSKSSQSDFWSISCVTLQPKSWKVMKLFQKKDLYNSSAYPDYPHQSESHRPKWIHFWLLCLSTLRKFL